MARFILLAKATGQSGRVEGDSCGVFPNNYVFGEREDKSVWIANGNDPNDWPGTFLIVTVLGIGWRSARRFKQPHRRRAHVLDPEFQAPDADDRFVRIGRNRWRFRLNNLPIPKRRELRENGVITLIYDKAVLNNVIIDKANLDVLIHDNENNEIDP